MYCSTGGRSPTEPTDGGGRLSIPPSPKHNKNSKNLKISKNFKNLKNLKKILKLYILKIHKNLVYLFKLYINKISMRNWNSYSPKEKAKLMQIFIRNGITDLNQMQEYINSFDINTKKNLNGLDNAVQALNKPTPTTYNTGGKKQSVEMTPSEAEALNKKLDTSQYMLAVGSSPEDPAYLSPGYLEPATVKAFNSQEDYNRHIGDKFGEYVSNSISNAGTKLAPVLAGTAAFPFALNLGMAAYANPFVRTALDVVGAIDGVRNFVSDNGVSKTIRLAKEGDTWGAVKSGIGDVFDIAGTTDLIRIGSRFNKANRALHAYNTISPEGYENPVKRFKTWFADIVNDKPVDIDNPQWKIESDGWPYLSNSASTPGASQKIYREARTDAWRIYNGLPQKYGTYLKNADGTYSYDLDRIKKIDPNFQPALKNRFDDITGAGGGLTWDGLTLIGENNARWPGEKFYVRTIEDIWDLHPFSRPGDRLNDKVNRYLKNKIGTQKFRNAAQNFRSYMYDKGHWKYGPRTLLGKATYFLDSPLNRYRTGMRSIRNPDGTILDYKYFTPTADNLIDKFTNSKLIKKIADKLANIEAGTIIGGTPFKMHTEIPITQSLGKEFWGFGGGVNKIWETRLGFISDDILPRKVRDYIGRPIYNKHNPIELFNDIYKITNVITGINYYEDGGDKDSSYIPNIFLDPLSLVAFNKSNDNKLGVPYRDFNSSDYSYYDANKTNMPTEKGGHWTSRNNETGQILKSPNHPTVIKEFTEGLKKGYVPYENPIDDLFYSIPKINSYPDIPMRNLNERYNIFEDDKANNSKKAHKESLDKFIKNNPTLYGLNTADFADFFSQLAGLEGSYKKDAGKGMMYSGYYGLKDGRDSTEDEQHKKAFKHLAGLFQNSIVKEDILKGLSLGYSPAQILAKYWNQGNRVTQFLWNGVDDKDGKGSKISEYGWNITADADYLKYLKDAITDDEVKVKDAKSLNEAIVRVRKPGINYSNREADILKFNRDRNDKFDTKKLRVGDTIYLTPLPKK